MAAKPITANADRDTYAAYLDAAWGLKNYWYPALFSHELPEGGVKGVEIAGSPPAPRSCCAAPRARPMRCRTSACIAA
jgi:hypothetical protein